MTQEEKVKAYDEAIKIAVVAYKDEDRHLKATLERIFPELKESDDEKIKEGLIDYFNNFHLQTFAGLEPKKILAWLEKQSEQKPAVVDFKAKDWYVSKVDGKIYNDKFMEKPTNQSRKLEIEKAAMSATGIIEQEEWFIKGAEWSDKNPYISSEKQDEQKSFARYKVGDTIYYDSFGRLVSFTIANIVEDGTDNPMYEDKDGNSVFQNEIVEHKPVDKVEPNFHFKVGQWIVATGKCVYLISKIDGFNVTLIDTNGNEHVFDASSLNDAHEWNIVDAKAGDVLEFGDHGRLVVGIVSYVNKSTGKIDVSCLLEGNKFKIGNYYALDTINPHPATKEQYNTFKNAMIDAGYTFDFEKKVLRKLKFQIGDEIKTANEGSLTITRIDCFGYWSDDLFICSFENSARWELIGKPVDKVESKFHEGDWIVGANNVFKIISLNDELNCYIAVTPSNEEVKIPYQFDNGQGHMCSYHLWTIQDAKDGDVLACNEEILLFKSYSVQGRISLYCWYNGQTNNFHSKEVDDTLLTTRNKICPAAKKQRDTLFAKMKEAGCEWDADKKELKNIMDEEDNNRINNLCHFLEEYGTQYYGYLTLQDTITWLKSLKDRVQPKVEWTEEDENMLKMVIKSCEQCGNEYAYYWLKSLKDRIGCKTNCTTMWKPSEEQMNALRYVTNFDYGGYKATLVSLYEQLKKLKD